MSEAFAHPFAAWESFSVITGGSAAVLTGLQFVLIALIAEVGRRNTMPEIAAFGTPTVLHFCSVLLVAAILSAPWPSVSAAGLAIGASGLAGVVYGGIVIRRARRQTGYQPVFEDWLWHAGLPLLAYAALLVAATFLTRNQTPALFVIAGGVLLLLFVGIHNAWDAATYVVMQRWPESHPRAESAAPSAGPPAPVGDPAAPGA